MRRISTAILALALGFAAMVSAQPAGASTNSRLAPRHVQTAASSISTTDSHVLMRQLDDWWI